GGLVSFNSYQLMGSVSGRANSSVAVIRDVNTLSYKATGLAPTSEYSFYLNTTDQCEGCSPPSLSSTISNIVNVNTPPLLAASATLATAIVGIWAFRRERSKDAGIHGLNSLPVYRPNQPRGRRL